MWRLLFIVVFAVIIGLELLVLFTFRKFLKKRNIPSKWVNLISYGPYILFILPFIFILVTGARLADLPDWLYNSYVLPFYTFTAANFFVGVYLLLGKIIKLPFQLGSFIISRFDKGKKWLAGLKEKRSVQRFDSSRRKFVTASAAAVTGYAFIGAGIAVSGKDDYEITNREITISNLPPALKGTTITLICDLHSGPYMPESIMHHYADIVNDIGSDIILIPGDLTNSYTSEAAPFAKAFRDVKAKHGIFATLGNHDYFSDPNYIADVVKNETPIRLMRNESFELDINGEKLSLIGVEDTRRSNADYDPELIGNLNTSITHAEKNIPGFSTQPKIMLHHKPYFIKNIAEKNVDLVVSGHTHGGQIVLAKFGKTNISLASTISPYLSGLYKEGNSQMYVSRGVGVVGLPLRLNCPPEITKITLV
ncbi:MAG: metallophosphoesterase [Ignavibacteriae bacterium]|nr:metallophosphoesterase [Ignavibacteriota bacterium]MCB9244088.1 metallophosphoesterase [Ignavibacteriales bacterium]